MVRFRYRTRKKNVDDYILHGGEAIGFPEHVRFLDNETDGQKTQEDKVTEMMRILSIHKNGKQNSSAF